MFAEYCRKARQLLSLENNCDPDDLLRDENTITLSAVNRGRRYGEPERRFFHMVTMGKGAVITADGCMQDFLRSYTADKEGKWLFELDNLIPIQEELKKHGYHLTGIFHMFLPETDRTEVTPLSDIKWYLDEELHCFYGDKRFPNAICEKFLPERPDRIVVCAYDGDEIMGMAGCSEDAPHWQQIGIDVMPAYRRRGVATNLVSLLKQRIEERGDLPFYGANSVNINSWSTARRCGFRYAWAEIGALKTGE